MIRFNILKIFINANEAKPGGNIGAMLSPYLFSTNMSDFCKRFNDQTKDFNINIIFPVKIYTDTIAKTYIFFLKPLYISMFFLFFFSFEKKISIIFLYDLILFCSQLYNLPLFSCALIIFSVLKTLKKKKSLFNLASFLLYKNI